MYGTVPYFVRLRCHAAPLSRENSSVRYDTVNTVFTKSISKNTDIL